MKTFKNIWDIVREQPNHSFPGEGYIIPIKNNKESNDSKGIIINLMDDQHERVAITFLPEFEKVAIYNLPLNAEILATFHINNNIDAFKMCLPKNTAKLVINMLEKL